MGICYDGPTLVPLPNYSQDSRAVSRDFTRELLRKHICFDIIFTDTRPISLSSQLPSWSPDWLSTDVPEGADESVHKSSLPHDADRIVHKKRVLDHTHALSSLSGEPNILKMQGVSIGSITAMTSVLGPGMSIPAMPASKLPATMKLSPEHKTYYGKAGSAPVADALIECLISWTGPSHSAFPSRLLRSFFYRAIKGTTTDRSNDEEQGDPWSRFRNILTPWLQNNQDFLMNGEPLHTFLQHDKRVSQGFVVTIWFMIIALAISFMMPGIYYAACGSDKFNNALLIVGCSITVVGAGKIHDDFGTRSIVKGMTAYKGPNLAQHWKRRLVSTEQGMLAMVSPSAEIGDEICFLAGCSSAVVLRKANIAREERYRVVGPAFASLSKSDEFKFGAFTLNYGERGASNREAATTKYSSWVVVLKDANYRARIEKNRERYRYLIQQY